MKKTLLLILVLLYTASAWAQPFSWSVNSSGMYRNGTPFYMKGQSWAKQTPITYNLGTSCESDLKAKLTELNAIGVNTLRVYGSPDDSDWSGTSNFANLIQWIEEWNDANPDGGDPNKAMYYFVQINPEDNLSTITDDLPENTSASFNRAIHDTSHPGSVASLVQTVDNVTGGSDFLLGYMIYHELNGSTKYVDWYNAIGASGIEDFMNDVADALHSTYAPGKLVTHTGDAKQPTTDIYEQIENLDSSSGNVFENFDIIGFNLYISTKEMLNEGSYYDRIPQRRGFSVNSNRGWYIGETGASSDVAASTGIPAVNYTQSAGMANLQIMWQKCEDLGNLIGFVLFTVQDNDLGAAISDDIKQRGYFDVYGDKKMLYYAYPDVVNEISTNERYHYTDDHAVGISIADGTNNYTITFEFENKTSSSKDFFWSIYGDDGSTSQRFTSLVDEAYVNLSANSSTTVVQIVSKPSSNDLLGVEAVVIDDLTPSNSYSYGRDHILADAVATVAGLNMNTGNLPDYGGGFTPNAPSNLSASGLTTSQIDLVWMDNSSVEDNFQLERSENGTTGWSQIATLPSNTTSYSDNGLTASKTYYYRILASNSTGSSAYSSVASATTKSAASSLPSPWQTQDVGAVAATGSASHSSGTFSIEGSGADIWGTADEFRYVYQQVSGDVTITARIASVQNTNVWAKAGVMVRESLAAGSKHAMSVVTPSKGTSFQRRTSTNGSSAHTTVSAIAAPYWVRIVRSGNTLSSYYSSNGSSWTSNGSATITMSTDVYVGLVTASHNDGTLCSASMDNVTVSTSSSGGQPATVTLSASDDAYVRGGAYAGTNYGSDTDLVIKQGTVSDYFRKSYVKFDLSGENLQSITQAVFRLYATSASSTSVTAYATTDSWSEGSITWNNAPTQGSQLTAETVSSSGQYYEWDITAYAQSQLAGDGVVSLSLEDAGASNTQVVLSSDEASANVPELVIDGIVSSGSRIGNSADTGLTSIDKDWQPYPNPSAGIIYFDAATQLFTHFRLLDLSGKQVLNSAIVDNSADLRVAGSGIYLLEVFTKDNQTVRKKIIIN